MFAALFAGTLGEDRFEESFRVSPLYQHGARLALMASAVFAASAIVAFVNLVRVAATGKTLPIGVPSWLDDWLTRILAIGVGLLIGTTVFR